MRFICSFIIGSAVSLTGASAEIRIATWNIGNLHSALDEPLRDGAPARNAEDIRRLNAMREAIDADVYSLQEVNGPVAARLIFPATQFDLCVSSRYEDDIKRGWDKPIAPGSNERRTDRIYTVIAIRRGPFTKIECQDFPHIGLIDYGWDGVAREVRRGVAVDLRWDTGELTLLDVHLKSSCHDVDIAPVDGENRNANCRTLERHINALEALVDAHIQRRKPIAIVGDFNRRLNLHKDGGLTDRSDHLWLDLNDNAPPGASFIALPTKTTDAPPDRACWAHQKGGLGFYYPEPIDFLMFDESASRLVKPETFQERDFKTTLGTDFDDVRYAGKDGARLSDHCPASVDLR
jgi:endonuclease/exonuclease/phosphatase family metal-dependent hydrolase